MGQQPSKGAGTPRNASSTSLDKSGEGLQAYPSLGKSDTKESSRSFRGLRSKIPGAKSDSPRNSFSQADATSSNLERADTTSSNKSGKKASKPTLDPVPSTDGSDTPTPRNGSPRPPPSPTLSASVGKGHKAVGQAQQQGEVDHVSDAPPTGNLHPSHNQQPKESILMKKNDPIPRSAKAPKAPSSPYLNPALDDQTIISSSPRMGLGSIKTIDLDEMITRLLDAGYSTKLTKAVCLKNAEITAICTAVREVFLSQPALVELTAPVKIVGDVHGQYTDLIRMFEMCGFPPNANFLFLGDYVDRGKQSLETILLLFCYKLKFPENFFLLRGNHECANVTRVYGFYDECKRRCNIKIWKTFIDTFNCLPIAAIVAGKIFCVHGGLSPSLTHMDDIRQIARPTDVPDYGLLNDLLWSDPADMEADWEANERGVSYCFGKKVIMEFLQRHDFDLVCRAHMVVEDGYEFFNDRILVTVFSAPNYCGEFDNWGAVMSVSSELLCSFELLKPLDSNALKSHIKKGRNKRANMLNSPASPIHFLNGLTSDATAYNPLLWGLPALHHSFYSWHPDLRPWPASFVHSIAICPRGAPSEISRLVDDLRTTQHEINRVAEYVFDDAHKNVHQHLRVTTSLFGDTSPQYILPESTATAESSNVNTVLYNEVQALLGNCVRLFYEADDLLKKCRSDNERWDPEGLRRRIVFVMNRHEVGEKIERLGDQKTKLAAVQMNLFMRKSAIQDAMLKQITDCVKEMHSQQARRDPSTDDSGIHSI